MSDLQIAEDKYKEAIRKRMGEIESRRIKMWKPKEKLNRFRILRAKAGDPWFYDVVVHFGLGPDGLDRVVCNVHAGESQCEACEDVAKFKASARSSDQKRADDIRASRQCLMNILDLEDLDKDVQIWGASEGKVYELMEYYVDPEWGDFTHPTKGYEVRMKRTGTGRNDTKYGPIKLAKTPSSVPDAKEVLKRLKDLSKVYRKVPNEEMRALLDGGDSGEFPCFAQEYSSDDEACNECQKAVACRRAYREQKKVTEQGETSAKSARGKVKKKDDDEDLPF